MRAGNEASGRPYAARCARGSGEDRFSQNNKRQICEAYVRRNRNLLLLSFQFKKEIRNLLFLVAHSTTSKPFVNKFARKSG